MLPLIRGLLPHPLPAMRIPNRAIRTCRRTRLPRFNAPVGDVPRDQRAGLPPHCSRWTASVAARSPPRRPPCARSGAADVGGSPHFLAGAYPTCPRRPAARGFSRPPLARGHATRYAGYRRGWFSPSHTPSHARLLHLPPPKIPLRRRLCAKTQAAPFPPGYFRERKGRSRRPSDAGPRADRAPLCGKSRAAPVPVQQLPGRLTNSEWPVFVPGGAPCLLYRRSRRRSIRGDRSSCFRLRITVR